MSAGLRHLSERFARSDRAAHPPLGERPDAVAASILEHLEVPA